MARHLSCTLLALPVRARRIAYQADFFDFLGKLLAEVFDIHSDAHRSRTLRLFDSGSHCRVEVFFRREFVAVGMKYAILLLLVLVDIEVILRRFRIKDLILFTRHRWID